MDRLGQESGACELRLTLPARLYTRPRGAGGDAWTEQEPAPGIYRLNGGEDLSVRAQGLNDALLGVLARELASCPALVDLNLAENRNVTDRGLAALKALPVLRRLNLSSCSITNAGLAHVSALRRLARLDLSYCNRLTDAGLKNLRPLSALEHLNLQGCPKITHAGAARLARRGLEIRR